MPLYALAGRGVSAQAHVPPACRTSRHVTRARTLQVLRASSDASTSGRSLDACAKGDLLEVVYSDGRTLYAEVLRPFDAQARSTYIAAEGELMLVSSRDNGEVALLSQGSFPPPSDRLFLSYPGWQPLYEQWCSRRVVAAGAEPTVVQSATVVHSLTQLQAEVQRDASFWCRGTGPGDAPLTPLQTALLNAGELLALEAGHRGICMLQLHVGWDAGARQPALSPFVPTLLHRLAADKSVSCTISPAAGGLGLTALLAADQEPWKSWARHMAGFGAQAAVVAQSPYYKLLIGTMMGYQPEHVLHHIKAAHGQDQPSAEVVEAVRAELRSLSLKEPALPWRVTGASAAGKGSRGGRKKAAKRR